MESWIDLEKLELMKFARSIESDCQDYVKWERRKLEWILAEKKNQSETESAAA